MASNIDFGNSPALQNCDTCKKEEISTAAISFCKTCSAFLCDDCKDKHGGWFQKHTYLSVIEGIQQISTKEDKLKLEERARIEHGFVPSRDPRKPSKPQNNEVTAESVLLSWDAPSEKRKGDVFEVRFTEISKESKTKRWITVQNKFTTEYGKINGLKSNTSFQFVVRVVDEEGDEGPKSEPSDIIKTCESLGTKLIKTSKVLEKIPAYPTSYRIFMSEVNGARTERTKTRRFEIGTRYKVNREEKTILVIGETGSGKSTMVDGMTNYILGVNFNDPFRFRVVTLEAEENERRGNQALSQTEWITCYTIFPEVGTRLNYTLNIIDTPGFGDTRGLEQDEKIVDQIRELFTNKEPKGVQTIDAVCFIVKASDARLTPIQSYIFQSIMSLFGKNIGQNICTLITFADGAEPMVCDSLKESGLPFGKHFTFNNSALFAPNGKPDTYDMSSFFWNMSMMGFERFFKEMKSFKTQSLQLTGDVLIERNRLQMVLKNLEPKIDAGLAKVSQINCEKMAFEKAANDMEINKIYTVTRDVSEQIKEDPEKGFITFCTPCQYMCHEPCVFEADEDKKHCAAMGSSGYCTVCPKGCFWRSHKNFVQSVFKTITKSVTETLEDIKAKYEQAAGAKLTQQQIIEQMDRELKKLAAAIDDMIRECQKCNMKLSEIALRPNPLTMTDHIELMIEAEKKVAKPGWENRIKVLEGFMKRAELQKKVVHETCRYAERYTTKEIGTRRGSTSNMLFLTIWKGENVYFHSPFRHKNSGNLRL
ncbi:uncharacterized protein LOC128236757 isoform X1 [Mya arenaria]|uniref:uncharacterized protein LOC128236757 isoform X1 n=1 Tax=Mya arenaria TaxID=6604 RepID=UPI0022E3E2F6|nr:uncharacterized protein LOC128236757 isoform X1 [Mya arenaria]